jgi:uncharacterized protein DUF1932
MVAVVKGQAILPWEARRTMTATIAVLGLGEAGGALARDLVGAGAVVRGYDPAAPGRTACSTPARRPRRPPAARTGCAVIENKLEGADASTGERRVSGSYRHAVRRTAEMAAAAEMLDEIGVPADVASAARDHLGRL